MRYPKEFIADVVAVARERDGSLADVARGFGVSSTSLDRWLAQADVDDGFRSGVTTDEASTMSVLNKRNRVLEQENEILRRAAAFFAKDISPK